jgi:hypothetical protein
MDSKMIRRFFAVALLLSLLCARFAVAAEFPEMNLSDFNDVASKHPAGEALKRLFPADAKPQLDFKPTGIVKKDYLKLIAGNVDFWKQHQNQAGAIIDPYEKNEKTGAGLEKQYSTPAFASAAALLIKEAGRDDLLEPASRAFDFALTALINKTTANQHADFYIPMLVHAYRILHDRAAQGAGGEVGGDDEVDRAQRSRRGLSRSDRRRELEPRQCFRRSATPQDRPRRRRSARRAAEISRRHAHAAAAALHEVRDV